MRQMRTFVETDIFIQVLASWTHFKRFHGNTSRWGISQLGISLVSNDLVFFSINKVKLLWQMILIVETDVFI